MNINYNNIPGADGNSGSPAVAAKTAKNPQAAATADAKTEAGDVAAAQSQDGAGLFQLLLGNATQKGADGAAPAATTDATADATPSKQADASTDLNLFIALLPGLMTAQTPATANDATPTPTSATGNTAAATLPAITATALPVATTTENATAATAATGASLLASLVSDNAATKESATTAKTDFTNTMQSAMNLPTAAAPTRAADAPTQTMRVDVPMHYPEWSEAVGHQVLWAAQDGVQKAELHINPEHLGPVHVKIHLEHDKADIQFAAVTPQAREALETSIPKLREMFAQQGLELHQAQVFSQTSQNPNGRQPQGQPAPSTTRAWRDEPAEVTPTPVRLPRMSLRLLDDYA